MMHNMVFCSVNTNFDHVNATSEIMGWINSCISLMLWCFCAAFQFYRPYPYNEMVDSTKLSGVKQGLKLSQSQLKLAGQ